MAPSVAETISHAADQIHAKVPTVSSKELKDNGEVKEEHLPTPALQEPAPAVQDPKVDEPATKEDTAPAVQEPPVATATEKTAEFQHKEPLKLSGALDAYESFDVTPVIGREFTGVNLVEWLRAPNSDELIRDLAITSMNFRPNMFHTLIVPLSLSARCCVLPKTGRRDQ